MMNDADVCHSLAGAAGKWWKRHRKVVPPPVKDKLAELLLELRLQILPPEYLDAHSSIGRARYDIRGVTELLRCLAHKQCAPSGRNGANDIHATPQVANADTLVKSVVLDTQPGLFVLMQRRLDAQAVEIEAVRTSAHESANALREDLMSGFSASLAQWQADMQENLADTLRQMKGLASECDANQTRSLGEAMCPSPAKRVRFDLAANSIHEYALEDAQSQSTEELENMHYSDDDLEEDPDYLEYLCSGQCRDHTAEAIDEDEYV